MLKLENISVIFNKGTSLEKVALENFNATIQDGDFITMLGSNGAGKSTLFNVITGALKPAKGKIFLGFGRYYTTEGACTGSLYRPLVSKPGAWNSATSNCGRKSCFGVFFREIWKVFSGGA